MGGGMIVNVIEFIAAYPRSTATEGGKTTSIETGQTGFGGHPEASAMILGDAFHIVTAKTVAGVEIMKRKRYALSARRKGENQNDRPKETKRQGSEECQPCGRTAKGSNLSTEGTRRRWAGIFFHGYAKGVFLR